MTSIVICSGSDHSYFPLLREMIYSIKRFPQAAGFKFAVIDAGLTDEDRAWLKDNVDYIHAPDWPSKIAEKKAQGKVQLKSCVCRPWINTYFPGHDIYIWMDADTWLQDWEGMALLIEGAKREKLAIAGQVDRCYPRAARILFLGPLPIKVTGFYYSNAKKAFGYDVAKKLYPFHVLQAGAFGLSGTAPHWKRWQELVLEAVKRGKVFTAEQLCLGILCYLEGYGLESLPAWTQWSANTTPLYDPDTKMLVEPYLPNKTLSILHLCGLNDMRLDRSITTSLQTTDGKTITGTLRVPDYDGEKDAEIVAKTDL